MAGEVNETPGATAPQVTVFADFVCPYCFIAQERVDQLIQDYDVRPVWRPYWLHPETPPEGSAFPATSDLDRRAATMAWLKEMAPERAARMRLPDKLQFSFFAFQALEFAQERGLALPFKSAVFDALWVEGKDIAQISTLQEAALQAGLNAEEMAGALYDQTYIARTLASLLIAKKAGVTKVPTFILGRTMIVGWHYYEVFQTVMEQQGFKPR
jgi:predicted DsbA family dithiol-disulfide isomerase